MSLEQQPSRPVGAGHFSLWIAAAAFGGATLAVLLGCLMAVAESLGLDMAIERLPGRPLAGLAIMLFLLSWLASLVGLLLGLACLTQPAQRRPSAVWGTALNALFFFGVIALLMFTWKGGPLP
jgi:hypothetical protein